MKMKKLSLIMVCIMVMSLFTLVPSSASAQIEGYYTYMMLQTGIHIEEVDTSISGDVVIPATLGGYPVKTIGSNAFRNCDNITSIVIPDSVTEISSYAFYGCDRLSTVIIGKQCQMIYSYAFCACDCLTTVVIHDRIIEIGKDAFYGPGYLTNVYYTGSEEQWNNISFGSYYCSGLGSEHINYNIALLYDGQFTYILQDNKATLIEVNGNITDEITIPSSVESFEITTIGGGAFSNIDNFISVEIPCSLTKIDDYAFWNCNGLASIEIGDGVTTIGDGAFWGCDSLTSIVIPDNVAEIGGWAFRYCQNLRSVVIGDNVTNIRYEAFYCCDSLTTIVIPDSVREIDSYAFRGCYNLTNVYYRGDSAQWDKISCLDLTRANITCNAVRIKVYDRIGEALFDKYVASSQSTYKSLLPDKSGYTRTIYTNNTFTDTIDADLYVTEDVDVYVEYTPVIEFCGKKEIVPNDNFVQEIYFATEKKANYLICEIVYPDVLELNSITPKAFKYASQESLKTKDGFNYLTVICQYADDETTVPENTSINPFNLSFTVSKTAKPQEIEIKFGEDTYLSGEEDYPFENKINAKIEILPKLASSVTIYGDSTIYEPYQYTAEVYPDYTTDKTIEWSVDDETVATISKDGVLTPVKNGSVKITATAVGGAYETKTVTVYRNAYVDDFKSDVGMWNEKILPDTKEYTIYVTEDTSFINITPLFTTGTLKYDNAVVMKNRPKEFELTENETTITFARSDTGYLDCTYTIKVIKKSELKNETIKAESFKEDCINVLVYNGNVIQIEETEDITITVPEKTNKYKVLYWESLANLKPVYAPITKEL